MGATSISSALVHCPSRPCLNIVLVNFATVVDLLKLQLLSLFSSRPLLLDLSCESFYQANPVSAHSLSVTDNMIDIPVQTLSRGLASIASAAKMGFVDHLMRLQFYLHNALRAHKVHGFWAKGYVVLKQLTSLEGSLMAMIDRLDVNPNPLPQAP